MQLSHDTHTTENDCVGYTTAATDTGFNLNYRDVNNPTDISDYEYIDFDLYLPEADCLSDTSHAVTFYLSSTDWCTNATILCDSQLRAVKGVGWNHVSLALSDFRKGANNTDDFDPTALTFMRLAVSGMPAAARTVKIDNVCFKKQLEGDGTLDGFFGSDGQIELTSGGANDKQEIHWSTGYLNLKAGWNTLYLPFETAEHTGTEEFNPAGINYFRFYQVTADSSAVFYLKIKDVAIVSKISSLRLHSLYGDGMLFQQNKPFVISGTAEAGSTVSAAMKTADGAVVSTSECTADQGGEWELSLQGMPGSYTEYDIVFTENGAPAATLQNVVFGELWLAAGQSNMEFYMRVTPSAQEILANSTDRYLKILYTPANPASGSSAGDVPYEALDAINGAVWTDATNVAILKECSAVAYYFAAQLRKELDIPVGFINVAQGATGIYGWLSREAIEGSEDVVSYLKESGKYLDRANWNTAGAANYKQMTGMYNQKIAPITRFGIAGMIWYQGENEIGDRAGTYAAALELLLADYSEAFGFENSGMPLIFAHLAPHYTAGVSLDRQGEFSAELDSVWRNHQENTAQIAIYDISLEYDYTAEIPGTTGAAAIHPMVKEPVGLRMANAALGMLYQKYGEYTSPVYTDITVDGNSLLIKFDHTGDGLAAVTPDDTAFASDNSISLNGFAVCGADGIYLPAKATLVDSDTVRVSNDTVKYPIGVSYAYTSMSAGSNLVSVRDGKVLFAAVPFCSQRIDGESFYHPIEWLNTESITQWRSNGTTADYYCTWRDGTLNPNTVTNISLSDDVKTEGASSIKFDVVTNQYWAFGISPNIFRPDTTTLFSDIDTSVIKYDTITFDIKQETGNALNLNLQIRNSADNLWYKPYLEGDHSESGGYTLALSATSDWQTVTVSLTDLQQGGAPAAIERLTKIINMEFTFGASIGANKATAVYFDHFRLGFSEEKAQVNKQPVLTAVEALKGCNLALYTKSTRTALQAALEAAQALLQTALATQEESDAARELLIAKQNALRLIGDCNADGSTDSGDLVSLRRILLEETPGNEAADTDENGAVDIRDLVRLKKTLVQ